MKKSVVYALWVTPDLSDDMERGEAMPPLVDLTSVKWKQVLNTFKDEFKPDERGVSLRIANDAIDQVTVHFREMGVEAGDTECRDFGDILYDKAQMYKGDVIPVMDEWNTLHSIKDRKESLPPSVIPFVVTGNDFNIARFELWVGSTMNVPSKRGDEAVLVDDYLNTKGRLTESLLGCLEGHFGIGYKPHAMLLPMMNQKHSSLNAI